MNTIKIIDYIKNNDYTVKGIQDIFKCKVLASSTDHRSAIIKIGKAKYDIYCIKPWAYCPEGLIEIKTL